MVVINCKYSRYINVRYNNNEYIGIHVLGILGNSLENRVFRFYFET